MSLIGQYIRNQVADSMGFSGETEEERRRRLEEEQRRQEELAATTGPVEQTIKTDSEGNTSVTVSGAPQDIAQMPQFKYNTPEESGMAPVAPVAPEQATPAVYNPPAAPQQWSDIQQPQAPVQPARPELGAAPVIQQPQAMRVPAPVAPQQPNTYNRMLQVESGNRDFNADGTPVTSPKGAMFASQVMPATAAKPGFGITPAQSQTPAEYNRVGQEYYQAMLKEFGGDNEKAIAAYNAGPQGVKNAVAQAAAQGGDWKQYIPAETKGYLQKVGAQQQPADVWSERLQQSQNDPVAMARIYQDQNAPEYVRQAAGAQFYTLATAAQEQQKAQQVVNNAFTTGKTNDLMREINKQGSEGSYIKAYLFQRLGLTELSKEEQRKLGAGNVWTPSVDANGKRAVINYDGNGLAIKGYDESGKELSAKDLAGFAASGVGVSKSETSAEVYYNPMNAQGPRFSYVKTPTGGRFVEVGTGRVASPQEQAGLVKMSAQGPLEQQALASYLRSGAQTQGQNAAELGMPQGPLPAAPGYTTGRPAQGGPAIPAPQAATPVTSPFSGQTAPGVAPTTAAAALPGQAPAPAVPGYVAPGAAPVSPAQVKQGMAIQKQEREAYVKYVNEDIVPAANNSGQVARIRREQINGPDGILNNPEIAGILQGQGSAATESLNLIRDAVAGNFKDSADVSARIRALDLSQRQKDVLYRQIGLQLQMNPQTLKANAGVGSISEAEHKLNRDANVDITRQPLYAGLSLMTRDQFNRDQLVYRQTFAQQHPELQGAAQFNSAWNAEKRRLDTAYDNIYKARAEYIAKYNKDGKNPGAVIDAYKHYPVPEWNPDAGTWEYKAYSAKAARPSLDTFKR